MINNGYVVFWFRRDLRLDDNVGLYHSLLYASENGLSLIPVFIFDTTILSCLDNENDARVSFIHSQVLSVKKQLIKYNSDIVAFYTTPLQAFEQITQMHDVRAVYANRDYEPDAISRDEQINIFLQSKNILFRTYKDHVIFEPREILKDNLSPYQVYTPYSKKWLETLKDDHLRYYPFISYNCLFKPEEECLFYDLSQLGFKCSKVKAPAPNLDDEVIYNYHITRNSLDLDLGTTRIGVHLRFGTLSIRSLVKKIINKNITLIKELIWREFFQMILFYFPNNTNNAFNSKYDGYFLPENKIDLILFEKWCKGQTGYLLIDAAMTELNQTGHMHNRARMLAANFLCKILHIDWRLGESYFASQLLDFELASNNGNWQWAAGCGCDAAPYFRVFNPTIQLEKFDPKGKYITKWLGKLNNGYIEPIVNFHEQRKKYLEKMKP